MGELEPSPVNNPDALGAEQETPPTEIILSEEETLAEDLRIMAELEAPFLRRSETVRILLLQEIKYRNQ